MKFTFDREKMLAAFQLPRQLPHLAAQSLFCSVKLIGTETSTTLMATDTEVGIRVVVEGSLWPRAIWSFLWFVW